MASTVQAERPESHGDVLSRNRHGSRQKNRLRRVIFCGGVRQRRRQGVEPGGRWV